jgi:hypothetical protein
LTQVYRPANAENVFREYARIVRVPPAFFGAFHSGNAKLEGHSAEPSVRLLGAECVHNGRDYEYLNNQPDYELDSTNSFDFVHHFITRIR